jgi:hypothetical protein
MAAQRRYRSGEYERHRPPSLEESIDRISRPSDVSSEMDVPATVVCAFCGDADCAGCENQRERSGIVAVIAWERTGVPVLSRLWSTARATTRDAEGFFELMPDGPLMPALRFAALCELLATSAVFAGFLLVAAAVAPDWVKHIVLDPAARQTTLRLVVLGLPAFAGLLVAAHAAHGFSIDAGARRQGAARAPSRALRFGLYACGWDLVMGPIGAAVVAVKEGARAALSLASDLSGLPTQATRAFLHGCYRLEGDRARKALGTSYVGAAVATLLFTVIVLVAVVAVVLA